MTPKIVTIKGIHYDLWGGCEVPPPRPAGRHKAVNNDAELISRAIQGLLQGKYDSYSDAARKLAPEAKTLGKKGVWYKTKESSFNRLRRANPVV